jgi:hypothetical protein
VTPGLADNAVAASLRALPNWHFRDGRVSYIDSYRAGPRVDIFLNKAQKYWYQHEFRFVAIPPHPATHLDPLFLELGPLTGFAELLPR